MRLRTSTLFTGLTAIAGAAVLAVGVGVAPASAASGFSFTVGGVGTGHPVVSGVNVGSIVFIDVTSTSKPKLVCTVFTGSGVANPGTGIPFAPPRATSSAGVRSVLDLDLGKTGKSKCTNTTAGAINLTSVGTWRVYTSGRVPGSTTKWYGYVANVSKHVAAASGTCKFDTTGVYDGILDTATSTIVPRVGGPNAGRLTLSNVAGSACPLLDIQNGDAISVSGTMKFSPAVSVTTP